MAQFRLLDNINDCKEIRSMKMMLVLLIAISLGGCLHIDVHRVEESTTTNSTSQEQEVHDN